MVLLKLGPGIIILIIICIIIILPEALLPESKGTGEAEDDGSALLGGLLHRDKCILQWSFRIIV